MGLSGCASACVCLCYVWYMMLSSSFHIPTSIFIVHILNLNSRVHERCAAPRFRALLFSLLSSLSVRLCFVVCAFSFEFCTQNVYSSVCLAAFWTWKTFLLLLLYISPSILLCFYYMLLFLLLFFLSIHCCCWLVFTLCFFCCFHFLPLNSLWTRSFS